MMHQIPQDQLARLLPPPAFQLRLLRRRLLAAVRMRIASGDGDGAGGGGASGLEHPPVDGDLLCAGPDRVALLLDVVVDVVPEGFVAEVDADDFGGVAETDGRVYFDVVGDAVEDVA